MAIRIERVAPDRIEEVLRPVGAAFGMVHEAARTAEFGRMPEQARMP